MYCMYCVLYVLYVYILHTLVCSVQSIRQETYTIHIDIYTGIYIDLYIYNPGEDNILIVIFPLKS
jgi:hypothetical protein